MTSVIAVAEVYLDGERVEFAGAAPATVEALHGVLEAALAEQHRVLVRLVADGVELPGESGARPLAAVARIDAESLPLAAALKRIAVAAVADVESAREQADVVASDVLRAPWAEAQARCIALADAFGRVLEGAATLAAQTGGTGAMTDRTQQFAATIDPWMAMVRARDAAGVCLELDIRVLPALVELGRALAELAADAV